MVAHIESLPVEIFDYIAYGFDLQTYHAVRLTSRQLRLLSFESYAKTHSSLLKTTLGSPSLDRLLKFSEHKHFSQYVTTLDITLLSEENYQTLQQIGHAGIYPIPKRFPKVSCVRTRDIPLEADLFEEVIRGEYPRCITDRLSLILRGFTELHTIRFRSYHADSIEWNPRNFLHRDRIFRANCFNGVIEAITRSSITLKEFSMVKRKNRTSLIKPANLPLVGLYLREELWGKLEPRFASLTVLTICLESDWASDQASSNWQNKLINLVSLAPHLRHLTLKLAPTKTTQLGSDVTLYALPMLPPLQHLTSFHLANASVEETHLAAFFMAHTQTLHEAILGNIGLRQGSWARLFTTLQCMHALRVLRLSALGTINHDLSFGKRGVGRCKVALDAGKMGRPMADMLKELADDCEYDFVDEIDDEDE